ncbi:MAG: protein translocase subunit SecF [Acidimicrobiia bacterium]
MNDTTPTGEVKASSTSLWHRLNQGETTFDFVGKRKYGFIFSGVLLLISLAALVIGGLNLGLEFKGGVSWEFPANSVSVDQTKQSLASFGLPEAKIQTLRSPDGSSRIRVQAGTQTSERQTEIRDALASQAGIDPSEVSVNSVSATWGDQVTNKAVRALVVFLVLLSIYISLRFEPKMAIASLLAMLHDVFISVGVYAVFRFAVTPGTVIAFLTILGFSLYDTVVVFDKVKENSRRLSTGKATYSDIVNLSMNQVLMRSINTSLSAILPVLSLLVVGSWILGATALEEFALALFVGLLTGSYSSIYIATPLLALFKEREKRYRQLAERVARTGGTTNSPAVATAAAAAAATTVSDRREAAADAPARQIAASTGAIPPRPRRKQKR